MGNDDDVRLAEATCWGEPESRHVTLPRDMWRELEDYASESDGVLTTQDALVIAVLYWINN